MLENEYLKATFLPEVGGRLISLFYKPLERELLHRNPVFQPANLAIRNAWFSGGIEWNIGQFGHTFTTCSPLFAGVIRGRAGRAGPAPVRIRALQGPVLADRFLPARRDCPSWWPIPA